MLKLFVPIAIGFAALFSHAALAQTPYVLNGGSFTAEQVEFGKTAYAENCAGCHGADFRSTDVNAPDLRGPSFAYTWVDTPLSERLDRMLTTMPPFDPGVLGAPKYINIIAYILFENGIAPSDQPLPNDSALLQEMHLTKQ